MFSRFSMFLPAEKGGRLGVGLATLPRKNLFATETHNDKSTNSTISGRRKAFLAKVYDKLKRKPKGSCNADYPSDDQKNLKHRNMEQQNNVRVRKDIAGSLRNANLQPCAAGAL